MFSYSRNKQKTKIKDVIIKNTPTVPYKEVLLNNLIEKDLQSALKPLNMMQNLFICGKYSIRDNFITSNSRKYNFVGIFIALIFRCIIFIQLMISIVTWKGASTTLDWCNFYDFFFLSIGFIINYCPNIVHCNNNALIVLKIQHVRRVLKIDGKLLESLVISNWAYVILLNILYLAGTFYYGLHFSFGNILDLISGYSSISLDINIVYATFVIILLRKTLMVWIMQISRNEEDFSDESHLELMYDLYLNILEAYKIFEKTFRLLIVYYIIHTVCHGLMTVAILLQMKQILADSGAEFALFAITSQSWLVKNMALQIILSFESERFYATMTEVKSVCTLLKKSRGCSDTQRRICKNIKRQQITSFNKFNAFGLFVIDATLPFQIFSVITAYTLTLLQFDLS